MPAKEKAVSESKELSKGTKVADRLRRLAGTIHAIADVAEADTSGKAAFAATLKVLEQIQQTLGMKDVVGWADGAPVALLEHEEEAKGGLEFVPYEEAPERLRLVPGFDRFTDRARHVLRLARRESVRLQHAYVGTEHLLLGMIEEKGGVAAQVLRTLEVDLAQVREGVNKIVQGGPVETVVTIDQMLPFTPRAKDVLEASVKEATELRHDYVGTEHLLLGLLVVEEGVAAQVLQQILPPSQPGTADGGTITKDAVSQLDVVRTEILEFLGAQQVPAPVLTAERVQALQKTEADWLEWWKQRNHPTADLQAVLDPLTHGTVLVGEVMEAVEDMVRSGFHAGAAHRAYEKAKEDTVAGWHEVISILGSYLDPDKEPTLPVCCEHDQMWIHVDPEKVSDEHKARLSELGWDPADEGGFQSYQNA